MKIKTVHACKVYLPIHGGIQRVVHRISEALSEALDTTVVSCSRDRIGEFRDGPVSIVNVKSWGEWLSLPVAPGFTTTFRKKIRESDLVCIHYPFPLAELALLFLNLDGKGLVVYWHSEIIAQKYARHLVRPLTHHMLKRADRIVLSSARLLDHSGLLQDYRSKCRIVPFGYDPPAGPPDADSDGDYYLCVGRHVSYKGIDTLIRAWEGIQRPLVLIGNGQLLEDHKKLAATLETSSRIEFIEEADDPEVTEYIAGCRALILPSVAANEAFGLVQTEAMAHGKPVINTRLDSGVPWVARDGIEAITVEPRDVQQMHDAIQRLDHDQALRDQMSQNARVRWQHEFNLDNFSARTETLYREVLDRL